VSAWGSEQEDRQLKDEVDRIAFLTFRTGELFADYGGKLEQARIALKDIVSTRRPCIKSGNDPRLLMRSLRRGTSKTTS
jgi:hypothetical protein